MRPFDGIIFDLGSTLIYFDGEWPEVLAEAYAELARFLRDAGLNLDEKTFVEEFRARVENYYAERETEFIEYTTAYVLRTLLAERGFANVPDAHVYSALEAMYRVSQAYWRPEEDAIPTLETLRARGYRLGMVSNAGDDADVQTLVDNAGLRAYFDVIVTSAAAGIRKPNPRIFEMVLDFWGIPPARAAMVGDTLGADILGARNAGLFGVWITRRAGSPGNRAHADTIQPDAVIGSLGELLELLEG